MREVDTMALLITPLLFLGFFSVACRVSAESANTKSNEHLITLRDYDFVGEDPRLAAALAQRLAVLQRPLAPHELATPARRRGPALPDVRQRPAYQPRPDYLRSNLNFPQLVNVSLDFADIFNASELIPDVEAWYTPAPAAAGLRGVPAPGGRSPTEQAPATTPTSGPAHGPAAEQFPGPGGRRQVYRDPSFRSYNNKILDLMKQSIYGTQRKILELDSVITRYEKDPRFRMAYIFNRLDEWLHDLRTVYTAMVRPMRRVRRLIWYYEHSLRINIDITYTIEHLVYLHSEYIKAMEQIVSKSKRMEMRQNAANLKKQNTSPNMPESEPSPTPAPG